MCHVIMSSLVYLGKLLGPQAEVAAAAAVEAECDQQCEAEQLRARARGGRGEKSMRCRQM